MDFEVSEFQTELADGIRRLCEGGFPLESIRARESTDQVVDRAGWAAAGRGRRVPPVPGRGGRRRGSGPGRGGAGLRGAGPGPGARARWSASHLAAGLVDGADDGSVVVGLVERPAPGPRAPASLPVVVEHLADLDVLLVLSDDGIERLDPAAAGRHAAAPARWTRSPRCGRSPSLPAGEPVAGPDVAAWWRRDGAVLTAALQVGMAQWACDLAVEYAKGRVQFGRPIGGFQAVKHLCADMAVRAEVARCAVQAAAVTVDQPDVGDADVAAAGAKLLADEAAVTNGRSSIQVHGGMGFTWEVPAHLPTSGPGCWPPRSAPTTPWPSRWPTRWPRSAGR